MKELIAKKSLGQHFLRSEKALNQIVDAIDPKNKGLKVFEIGPGEGVLTEKLLQAGYSVTVIEIDKRSIELLESKFAKEIKEGKLEIVDKDCLEMEYAGEYVLLGNIPYYITGAIFRQAFEQKELPKQIIFLVQKEVAERIVARNKKESLLSISIKIFTEYAEDVKIVDIVKAGSFVPPPKVDSAIISVKNIQNVFGGKEKYEIFFQILKAAFSHKRKYLLSNLKTDLEENFCAKYIESIKEIISEKERAEDISTLTWKKIISSF